MANVIPGGLGTGDFTMRAFAISALIFVLVYGAVSVRPQVDAVLGSPTEDEQPLSCGCGHAQEGEIYVAPGHYKLVPNGSPDGLPGYRWFPDADVTVAGPRHRAHILLLSGHAYPNHRREALDLSRARRGSDQPTDRSVRP